MDEEQSREYMSLCLCRRPDALLATNVSLCAPCPCLQRNEQRALPHRRHHHLIIAEAPSSLSYTAHNRNLLPAHLAETPPPATLYLVSSHHLHLVPYGFGTYRARLAAQPLAVHTLIVSSKLPTSRAPTPAPTFPTVARPPAPCPGLSRCSPTKAA